MKRSIAVSRELDNEIPILSALVSGYGLDIYRTLLQRRAEKHGDSVTDNAK